MYIELNLPEARMGAWSIQTFYKKDMRYQKLMNGPIMMMANTPDVVKEYEDFLLRAEGSILINGLGIGMCCQYLLEKASVTDITVIEYEKTLIDLLADNFHCPPRCVIIHENAFTYTPPKNKHYDYVWHDIWTYYMSKNLKDMEILFQKFQGISSWQGAWCYEKCLELLKKESNNT